MNTLKSFLDSLRGGQVSDSVLFVQKGVAQYVFGLLGYGSFGRRGMCELNKNLLFQFKTPQDIKVGTKLFQGKNQFILTGSDVLRKGEVSGIFDDCIFEELPSEKVWGSPSTLSVFGPMDSLERMARGTPPDIIYTRGAPILTKKALDRAYADASIDIREVDGNTEAFVAIESKISKDATVCGTEFVQTGRSLQDTGSFILREDGIYLPQRGDDGGFILSRRISSTSSQIFSNALTLEVKVLFAQIFRENA
ncbi:MAG: hypothetical protein HHAS10_09220 [Candidatus Altimarinota bacterium]